MFYYSESYGMSADITMRLAAKIYYILKGVSI